MNPKRKVYIVTGNGFPYWVNKFPNVCNDLYIEEFVDVHGVWSMTKKYYAPPTLDYESKYKDFNLIKVFTKEEYFGPILKYNYGK